VQYGEFLPETFFMECGNARVMQVIRSGSEAERKKLFKMLGEVFEDGTNEVQDIIAVTILGGSGTLTILTVSATLGGAVFGDHISPISDTTILASAGAQCNHVEHVNTQLPYAALVAGIAAVSYVVAGLCASMGSVLCCTIMWVVALVLFAACVLLIRALEKKKANA
jgi:hypothetical protein